jgi:hypothetical protein
MDRDEVWRVIDAERASLADLLDSFGEQEWEVPLAVRRVAGP